MPIVENRSVSGLRCRTVHPWRVTENGGRAKPGDMSVSISVDRDVSPGECECMFETVLQKKTHEANVPMDDAVAVDVPQTASGLQ